MGSGGKKSGVPDPKPVEIPAPMPVSVDDGVRKAADDERRERLAAKGYGSTILTGGTGLNSTAKTEKKQLLGE